MLKGASCKKETLPKMPAEQSTKPAKHRFQHFIHLATDDKRTEELKRHQASGYRKKQSAEHRPSGNTITTTRAAISGRSIHSQ